MTESLPPAANIFIPINTRIIVGLSGGPDSICLLHLISEQKKQNNLHIIAVHLDHEWQESSKIAAEVCRTICKTLDINLIVKKLSDLNFDVKWNGSQEELGRKMRRFFFESVAHEYKADAIALAHHQQDQHETFFIRIIRSSSLKGLIGMKEHDGLYTRPLLHWSKKEIMNYLAQHNLSYYTDPTNFSDKYLRNRIRHHVIPAIQSIDHRFEASLTSTMSQLSLAQNFIEQQTLQIMESITTKQGIMISSFLQNHVVIQQNILLQLMIKNNIACTPSQKLFKEIVRFLKESTKNKHTLYQNCLIKKDKSYFSIEKIIKIDKNL